MLLGMLGDFFQDAFDSSRRLPVPLLFGSTGIQHQPGHVITPQPRLVFDLMRRKMRPAPFAKLRQRDAVLHAPADVDNLAGFFRMLKLTGHQAGQVTGMQTITDLLASAAKAQVPQRPLVRRSFAMLENGWQWT